MAKTYKTPGTYIEEIVKLPPSVTQIDSSIPIFIGYTEKASDGNKPLPTELIDDILIVQAKRITSLIEYELYFGKTKLQPINVRVEENNATLTGESEYKITVSELSKTTFHNHMQMYFVNGGGPCFIISVGVEKTTIAPNNFLSGLKMAARYDEPSLTVIPQVNSLLSLVDYGNVYVAALQQAADLNDRFVIMDCYDDNPENLRSQVGNINLRYGAAYHPSLQVPYGLIYNTNDLVFDIIIHKTDSKDVTSEGTFQLNNLPDSLQALIKAEIGKQFVTLPPCSTIAGIYARTDNSRGVWKAPANVSLNWVASLTKQITDDEQSNLNVDQTYGKSINAIKSFTGKGFLVWGARTLAGNDNEWRYVPVQRFITMIEQSSRKATASFAFEPNDSNTWVKIKAMLESFLTTLWRQGAMQGVKPEQAFYVRIGLNQTMTNLDILEGRLIIEMGIAAVRPAEFIILKLSQKMKQTE